MSAPKNLLRRAMAAKIEASYNSGGSVAYPADAFHTHEEFDVPPQYQFDGARSGTSAGSSMQVADGKSGRFCDVEVAHRVHTPGSAYSSGAFPTVHALLRAHGMSATGSFTGGSEKWTYAPFTDGTWESIFGEFYLGKEKRTYQGGYVYQWTHTAEGAGTPEWRFKIKAPLGARVADAALPSISAYPYGTVSSPKAAGSVLTISATGGGGTFQGFVRKSVVTSSRAIDDRMSQTLAMDAANSGHAGFQLGPYTQTLDVTVEATNLAASYSAVGALDPERMAEEGTAATIVLGFNQGVQYKRYKFVTGATAQIREAQPDKAGAIRLWNLSIALPPSLDVLDDGLSVVFD